MSTNHHEQLYGIGQLVRLRCNPERCMTVIALVVRESCTDYLCSDEDGECLRRAIEIMDEDDYVPGMSSGKN